MSAVVCVLVAVGRGRVVSQGGAVDRNVVVCVGGAVGRVQRLVWMEQ